MQRPVHQRQAGAVQQREEKIMQQQGATAPADCGQADGPGYCPHCGYSLFHYAGKTCHKTGEPHPEWRGEPPPSFAEVNR